MHKIKKFVLTKSIGFYINTLHWWKPEKAMLLAYELFSSPRDGKLVPGELPQVLTGALAEKIYDGDDFLQTYYWPGNGELVLLLHGWESNASRWEKLLPQLQQTGYSILAIDAPAHGLSSGTEFNVPQYAHFIDKISTKYNLRYIIGHSLGGIAGVYYQHHYPGHGIEKMVLLGAPSDFEILLDNYANLLGLGSRVRQALAAYTKKRFNIEAADFSGRLFLRSATFKGLIAHDALDEVVAFTEAEKLASGWKTAKLIQTSGLGHSLHDEDLYAKIIAFLGDS